MIKGTIPVIKKETEIKSSDIYNGLKVGDKVILASKTKIQNIFKEDIGIVTEINRDYKTGFKEKRNRFEPIVIKWPNGMIETYAYYDIEKLPEATINSDKEEDWYLGAY